ncbi:MAG: hypothetical protein A2445_03270 [Candidatus Jacksonbacteria bacterium RIFOXYC2_FULL_44_29]|nr:MAG: Mg2+ transporter protein, CorA family protein [Parcubacteria group bacterium GW2011_GWC2_44_22]OGY75379.1 MAG: hypothetical protein A2240_03415 [Candidatus Jacksonbacteria bacterium RIFOXYA2_FULL_43_12]OGY77085.1 MAG: hypothetical protein A2295_05090 [Candidatus Jacksonbacteria bacterium RIFOXYB2_FULL_44_15]OGY78354.1 MAG: hypothetical protein A2550_00355 [Candidatus Jacksonbacteria bacterium RIFOXYD2_FULL_43_21]OGY79819.1 MAG: hypothetical protein A2445_03270 [Candidatus Jacksonbacteri
MEKIIYNDLTWLNFSKVTKQDTEYLREEFDFHPLDLSDCLGAPQRPKVDIYDQYFFLVLHFPLMDKNENVVRTPDLDIFLTKTHLITVQREPVPYLNQLFAEMEADKSGRSKMFQKSTDLLLYYVLNKLYHESLAIIDELNKEVKLIEDHIYASKARRALLELAVGRRNNLTIRAILNPQRLVINTCSHMQKDWFNKNGDATLYFDDILDYVEKNWILLENQKELIDGLHETNQSLISYRTNSIITVLTVFSVAIMPLTLLTGFFGMNVDLPLQENVRAVWLVFLTMALLTISIIYYVVTRKKWI